jgi:S1-C subfamily serine protease
MSTLNTNNQNPFDMLDNTSPENNQKNEISTSTESDNTIWNHPVNKVEPVKPDSNNQSKNNPKKKNTFFGSVNNFFRTIGIFVVLLILIFSSVLGFILIKPDSSVSKWLVSNTALKNYLLIQDSGNSSNIVVKQDQAQNISGFLGLNDSNTSMFQFAQPQGAKTTVQVVQDSLPSVLSLSISSDSSKLGVTDLVAGTGYIVSDDGLVVTNKHVIASKCAANSDDIKISALSHDQKAYQLDLLTVDPIDDIAILKIENPDNEKFTPVKFADSNNIPVGDEVIAIGNVLGQLQNSVTQGIVSGLDRTVDTTGSSDTEDQCTSTNVTFIDNLIQTDAAINRGNSGGPLFDSTGLLIGMNTLGTTDSQNIGFAISSNLIVSDLNSYKQNGKIVRPRLGIYSKPINSLEKQQNSWLPVDYGEILLAPSTNEPAVTKGSSAEAAGLQAGDIILELNGQKLVATEQNPSPLRRMILSHQPNEEVQLVVKKAISGNPVDGYQYDSQEKTITVKLGSVDYDLNNTQN